MTVEDLLYFLEEGIENGEFDLETEIRFGSQRFNSIEHKIKSEPMNIDGTIYLTEEYQIGYLDQEVKKQLNLE